MRPISLFLFPLVLASGCSLNEAGIQPTTGIPADTWQTHVDDVTFDFTK